MPRRRYHRADRTQPDCRLPDLRTAQGGLATRDASSSPASAVLSAIGGNWQSRCRPAADGGLTCGARNEFKGAEPVGGVMSQRGEHQFVGPGLFEQNAQSGQHRVRIAEKPPLMVTDELPLLVAIRIRGDFFRGGKLSGPALAQPQVKVCVRAEKELCMLVCVRAEDACGEHHVRAVERGGGLEALPVSLQ